MEAFSKCDFEEYYELNDTLTKIQQMKFVQDEKAIQENIKEMDMNGKRDSRIIIQNLFFLWNLELLAFKI